MSFELPEPIRDILGNPRYKFAILIILSLLAVFFIYGGGEDFSLGEYLPEMLAASTVLGGVEAAISDDGIAAAASAVPVDVNIEMLAPF